MASNQTRPTHGERFVSYLTRTKSGISFVDAQGEVLDMAFTDIAALEARVKAAEADADRLSIELTKQLEHYRDQESLQGWKWNAPKKEIGQYHSNFVEKMAKALAQHAEAVRARGETV